jgi:hypothetical protein
MAKNRCASQRNQRQERRTALPLPPESNDEDKGNENNDFAAGESYGRHQTIQHGRGQLVQGKSQRRIPGKSFLPPHIPGQFQKNISGGAEDCQANEQRTPRITIGAGIAFILRSWQLAGWALQPIAGNDKTKYSLLIPQQFHRSQPVHQR